MNSYALRKELIANNSDSIAKLVKNGTRMNRRSTTHGVARLRRIQESLRYPTEGWEDQQKVLPAFLTAAELEADARSETRYFADLAWERFTRAIVIRLGFKIAQYPAPGGRVEDWAVHPASKTIPFKKPVSA